MKAVILAGGMGTRLRERIQHLPKPMAPVDGRPFLEYVLDRLIAGGIHEIILSVSYRADDIIEHFGEAYRNITVSYAVEHEPLGTGGAIAYALDKRGDDPVLVMNGDTLLNINYNELIYWYLQTPTQVAMVLRKMPDVSRYGTVLLSNEHVVGFLEKGNNGSGLINAGVYVVQPNVFETFGLSGKFSFEIDFLQKYCTNLLPRAFLTDEYFIDIGIPDDYDRAQYELPNIS
jgi:D-glycero-alpha-D-manno-heptose 1-phosphate guanylyltransferase